MKFKNIIIFVLLLATFCFSDIGQSAVITLIMPYGARGTGMGEVGTALADDMGATFYNPAGTAIKNEYFRKAYGADFFEPLLPIFRFKDLWHRAIVGQLQYESPFGLVGGVGIFYNFINFGKNVYVNEKGIAIASFKSYEWVLGLNFSIGLAERKSYDMGLGLNFKYVKSALDRTLEGGIGRTIAFDLGYLYKSSFGLNFGINFMNMGPAIYYTSKDDSDPIPFTVRIGLGFERDINKNNIKLLKIKCGYDLEREMVYNEVGEKPDPFYKAIVKSWTDQPLREEWEEVIHHIGTELTFHNTWMLRYGVLKDNAGSRQEFNYGFGLTLFNTFETNYSVIISKEGSPARHGQWRVDFVLKKMGNWKKSDLKWYMVDDKKK